MATVTEVYRYLDTLSPFSLQESYDNAGFLVGHGEGAVHKLLVSLDITEAVVEEAARWGAELIVSHHPILFYPARTITDGEPVGRILLGLIEQGIAAICAHTNLDMVPDGVNDVLARKLCLEQIGQLHQNGEDAQGRPCGVGRVGVLSAGMPSHLQTFAGYVKRTLGANGVRYVDVGKPVRRVAVAGGACSDYMGDALAKGCDTFVTSDVKYNGFLNAKALGINLIDAGHYPTEQVICPTLCDWLTKGFPGVAVRQSAVHTEVFSYL